MCTSSPSLSLSCLGQIAANEALKKDLEGVISGLQEYLGTVKGQAAQAQNECRRLQDEKEALLQRLTEVQQERDQLEIVALDAENMRKVCFASSCLFLASEVGGVQMKLVKGVSDTAVVSDRGGSGCAGLWAFFPL